MAKSEDIEGKLAEYVDGRLDAADRGEIEKHLAENPQHRQLIAELSQHRQLLKNLPREHAPGDVAESINAQLERAVLLGDIDDDSHLAGLRMGRGPQFRAIAAVLLLTVGLAAVIYYFLPSPNRKPAQIADLRSAAATTAPAEMPFALMQDKDQSDDSAKSATESLANATPETEQERRARLALDGSSENNDQKIFSNVKEAPLFRGGSGGGADEQLNGANPAVGMGPVMIVIPSADPSATHRQVTDYLTSNKINWETSSEPTPKPMQYDRDQVVLASKAQQMTVQQIAPPATNATATSQIVQMPLENQPTGGETGQFIVAKQLPRQQAIALGAALENFNSQQLSDRSLALRDSGATTQPMAMIEPTMASKSMLKPTTQTSAGFGGATTRPANGELVLEKKPLAPTTMPRRIEVGDTLDIRVPQLVGPGVEPQSLQRVEAGGISLPMLDQVPVVGLSEAEAGNAIAQKYRDAKLIPNATATVAIATTQPTGLSIAAPPTSQPAADLVDVVIMVQQSPTTRPNTQPTTAPTTQQ